MRMLSQRRGGYVDKSIRHALQKLKRYLKLKRRYVTLELSFAVTIAPILFYEDSPYWTHFGTLQRRLGLSFLQSASCLKTPKSLWRLELTSYG